MQREEPGAIVYTHNRKLHHLLVNHFTLQTNFKALTSFTSLHRKKFKGFVTSQIFHFSYLEMANVDLIATTSFIY